MQLSENQPVISFEGKKVLVAVSGGLDSVVLLHWLDFQKVSIILAHCNFQLRGEESNLDERFVIDLGKKLNIETITQRFDTQHFANENGLNIQLSARKLRYDWFEELAQKYNCDFIATAHHADDNLETFFINLLRGTGLNGLTGIPAENGKIIRPLLGFTRDEIYRYAIDNQLVWREDSSNASDKYLRNKIRHHIIPTLKEINPFFVENFEKTQHFLKNSSEFIDFFIKKIKSEYFITEENQIKIDISVLKEQPVLDLVLHELFHQYDFKNVTDIKNLLYSQSGKQLFSSTHRLLKDRNFLILKKNTDFKHEIFEIKEENIEIKAPFSMKIEILHQNNHLSIEKNEKIAFIDADLLQFPLKIQKKRENDYFFPLGMKQKKSVSKFFKDEKLSIFEKENQWILYSAENIVWIIGRRLDNRFKITEKTKKILKITIF